MTELDSLCMYSLLLSISVIIFFNVGVTASCLVYFSVTYCDVIIVFRIVQYNRLVHKN